MLLLSDYHESVLKFFIDLRHTTNFQTFISGFLQNALSGREDHTLPKFFDALCSLNAQGYIIFFAQAAGVQYITSLSLLPRGLDYFQEKQRYLTDKKLEDDRARIRWLIPVIISAIAIIISIIALYISVQVR